MQIIKSCPAIRSPPPQKAGNPIRSEPVAASEPNPVAFCRQSPKGASAPPHLAEPSPTQATSGLRCHSTLYCNVKQLQRAVSVRNCTVGCSSRPSPYLQFCGLCLVHCCGCFTSKNHPSRPMTNPALFRADAAAKGTLRGRLHRIKREPRAQGRPSARVDGDKTVHNIIYVLYMYYICIIYVLYTWPNQGHFFATPYI